MSQGHKSITNDHVDVKFGMDFLCGQSGAHARNEQTTVAGFVLAFQVRSMWSFRVVFTNFKRSLDKCLFSLHDYS